MSEREPLDAGLKSTEATLAVLVCCGRWVVDDDDDEIDRMLDDLGIQLPDVEDDAPDDEAPAHWDDLEDWGWT